MHSRYIFFQLIRANEGSVSVCLCKCVLHQLQPQDCMWCVMAGLGLNSDQMYLCLQLIQDALKSSGRLIDLCTRRAPNNPFVNQTSRELTLDESAGCGFVFSARVNHSYAWMFLSHSCYALQCILTDILCGRLTLNETYWEVRKEKTIHGF